mgnify:CR=1 FL=1
MGERTGEAESRSGRDKRWLRARLLAARRDRDRQGREEAGSALRDSLLELPWLAMAGTVACYYSVGGEPDTHKLVMALWKRGTHVLLPVFLPDGNLDWAAFDGPDDLAPSDRGLLEPVGRRHGRDAPARVDAILCPALAVDRRGTRLGRGAGCYDRALARKGPHTPAIALVYDDEFVEELPAQPHDVPVDAVATPGGGVHVFSPSAPVWRSG